jgi:hypothetical protein
MDRVKGYTSAGLAVVLTVGLIVLIALGQTVPTELWGAFGVIVGFFFGQASSGSKA